MRRARLVVSLLVPFAFGARVAAAPPVPWSAAGEHVRRLVTIEGVVARATASADRRCVLEFAPDDPAALRVVLLIPFVTDLPADPSRLYEGKRVQVTGRVMRFQNRLEMLVTPAQLEVVGLTAAAPSSPTVVPLAPSPPPPAPATPAAVAPSPAPPPPAATPPAAPDETVVPAPAKAPPAVTPVPRAPVAAAPTPVPLPAAAATDPRCRPWREERTAIRSELETRTAQLAECLAADRRGCAALGDRLGVPLSRLAAVEAHLDRYCP